MNNTRYVVNLHILEQCNYKCKYCFAHYESNKILSLDQWKLIVDNVSESISVKRFNIAGGEPLLYPKLNELISYINSKGIPVSIITNGILLSESFIEINSTSQARIPLPQRALARRWGRNCYFFYEFLLNNIQHLCYNINILKYINNI